MASESTSSARQSMLAQPFGIQWRKALVSLPRMVPLAALKYTSSEGPQPFILQLPSRGRYLIPIYVFVPPNPAPEHSAHGLPVVIDFHGGGFVLGSCLEQGPFCAKLARDLGAVILCVDYRMGPTDKFPAAIEDGEDVLSAVLDENARGGKELREAINARLGTDAKKALKKARKQEKREARALRKVDRKAAKKHKKGNVSSGSDGLLQPTLSATNLPGKVRPAVGRTDSESSLASKSSLNKSTSSLSIINSNTEGLPTVSRTTTGVSASAASSMDDLALPDSAILDTTRIALSGFSSGGNLILNLALSLSPSTENIPPIINNWPSRFPASFPAKIPLLLYFPSFDCRPLPGERPCPPGLEKGGGFWSEANDLLMPTYLPRDWAGHPRASPGLADLGPPQHPSYGRPSSIVSRSRTPSPVPTNPPSSAPTSAPLSTSNHPPSYDKATAEPRAATSINAITASEAASAATTKKAMKEQAKQAKREAKEAKKTGTKPADTTNTEAPTPSKPAENVPPPGLHPQAKMQLVLPQLDSLSEQSEIWVKVVRDTGRMVYEWDYQLPHPSDTSSAVPAAKAAAGQGNGATTSNTAQSESTQDAKAIPYTGPAITQDLEVLRYPGQKHGWTQMPENWLDDAARATRMDAFEKSIAFVRGLWDERERVEMREAMLAVRDEEEIVDRQQLGSNEKAEVT